MKRQHYAEKLQDMPPLANLPPYDDNEIVRWFAQRFSVTLKEGRRLWDNARTQSNKSHRKFLFYDPNLKLWSGRNHRKTAPARQHV